eukprot:Plantae.Rhodophyta-Hildenbrandia_rubra.ctg24103.p5 GENE.Plantae.Rhodophyta-Hildenbrandia_rubra.ctg24103~~Plantae.Rhodophyta-Hildenbrandia_rubra.ctg24103.p5  ORF type:complete len:111 (+),score=28.65 Plantae.Rhodophyta-Hildenbrandia_rubra.ctg24103:121-453(+)
MEVQVGSFEGGWKVRAKSAADIGAVGKAFFQVEVIAGDFEVLEMNLEVVSAVVEDEVEFGWVGENWMRGTDVVDDEYSLENRPVAEFEVVKQAVVRIVVVRSCSCVDCRY